MRNHVPQQTDSDRKHSLCQVFPKFCFDIYCPRKMPGTSNGDAQAGATASTSQPSQKSMSKAERRELQEKQRAAKLAQKQEQTAPASTASSSKPKPAAQKKSQSAGGDTKSSAASSQRDASNTHTKDVLPSAAAEDSATRFQSRGLRIFSHFGLPKPHGHVVKGDIHPVIIRLGLQFSEFRICGANARCIATLTAFKTVTSFPTPLVDFGIDLCTL